jgi:hypothetical protein
MIFFLFFTIVALLLFFFYLSDKNGDGDEFAIVVENRILKKVDGDFFPEERIKDL